MTLEVGQGAVEVYALNVPFTKRNARAGFNPAPIARGLPDGITPMRL